MFAHEIKPPAAPSGPHHCKDKHVEAGPIRLSTAEEPEMTQSLRIVPQSIMPQSAKNGIKGNLNDGNENNASGSGEGGGEEEGGGSEEEGGGNLGAIALVSPHRMIQRGGVTHINKSVYWDSTEAAKLFGFNEGEDMYSKLEERVTLLKARLAFTAVLLVLLGKYFFYWV